MGALTLLVTMVGCAATTASDIHWEPASVPILWKTDAEPTLAPDCDTVELAQARLRDARFWAQKYHERIGGPYEATEHSNWRSPTRARNFH